MSETMVEILFLNIVPIYTFKNLVALFFERFLINAKCLGSYSLGTLVNFAY